MCEKGKWDCVTSKYHLCGQEVATAEAPLQWWDYTRCLYKKQPELIEYYYAGGSADAMAHGPGFLKETSEACAADAGMDEAAIEACATSDEGVALLKESYERVKGMGQTDPVWVFVEGQRIGYHQDWLAAICAAVAAKGGVVEECSFYADV
jgi:hypothetical protein